MTVCAHTGYNEQGNHQIDLIMWDPNALPVQRVVWTWALGSWHQWRINKEGVWYIESEAIDIARGEW